MCRESGKDKVKLLGFIYTINHNLQATAWLKLVQASILSEMGDDWLAILAGHNHLCFYCQ